MIKVKINDFIIKVAAEVEIFEENKKIKSIPVDKFIENGMKLFPKKLYSLIKRDLKSANQYDKLMEKIFDCYR